MIKTIPQNAFLASEVIRKTLSENFAISSMMISNGFQRTLISVNFNSLLNYATEPEQDITVGFSDQFLSGLTPDSKIIKTYNKLSLNITKYLESLQYHNIGQSTYSYRVSNCPYLVDMLRDRNTIFYVSDIYDPGHYLANIHMDSSGMIITSFKKIKKKSIIGLIVTSVNLL